MKGKRLPAVAELPLALNVLNWTPGMWVFSALTVVAPRVPPAGEVTRLTVTLPARSYWNWVRVVLPGTCVMGSL